MVVVVADMLAVLLTSCVDATGDREDGEATVGEIVVDDEGERTRGDERLYPFPGDENELRRPGTALAMSLLGEGAVASIDTGR